ncbi:MAG: carotenoid 1,2-hydratase [Candidatus Latescibacteria bacterium]|nr:carotenoid 1,2-hydratase [Candidatus Latescibacterota bacterium]
MRIALVFYLLALASVVHAEEWKTARPDYPWSFPCDHWARDGYKTEWWYFTGHLTSDDGRRFGYQFTFFRVGMLPQAPPLASGWATGNVIMGHAAIGDHESQRHFFSEVIYRITPLLGGFGEYPDTLIAWSRAPAGTDARWTLRWNGSGFDFEMTDTGQRMGFSLSNRPAKPMIYQGPNGFSRKGNARAAASQYYSFTRLATTGEIRLNGERFAVTGRSWMDKEFGSNQLEAHQVGWDWFSLQLDDGRDVMLYVLRDTTGAADFARGTIVSAAGHAGYLGAEAFSIRATQTWRSPETDAVYPSRWEIELPGEDLRMLVRPVMADQENRSALIKSMFYWEGAVEITGRDGKRMGRGYVELVGYGTDSRPRL